MDVLYLDIYSDIPIIMKEAVMKRAIILLLPLLLFAPTLTFYCEHGWGYYYWLFGPVGPSQSEGMAAAGYQSVEYRGYVQFDVYGYPGSGTTINSLVLRVRNNTGGAGLQVDINRVTAETPSWQECGGTAPIYATNLAASNNPEEYSYFDLSGTQAIDDFLALWQAGGWFGFGMKGSRGSGEPCMHFFYAFWANEYYDAALLVDYGIVGIEDYHDSRPRIQEPRIMIRPNPAKEIVDITVQGAENAVIGETMLIIYNSAGRIVRSVPLPVANCARCAVQWDCRDRSNQRVAPGVYFITVSGVDHPCIEKLVVLR
jgi:hypothetical protein